jgi:hypothetical protein
MHILKKHSASVKQCVPARPPPCFCNACPPRAEERSRHATKQRHCSLRGRGAARAPEHDAEGVAVGRGGALAAVDQLRRRPLERALETGHLRAVAGQDARQAHVLRARAGLVSHRCRRRACRRRAGRGAGRGALLAPVSWCGLARARLPARVPGEASALVNFRPRYPAPAAMAPPAEVQTVQTRRVPMLRSPAQIKLSCFLLLDCAAIRAPHE